MSFHDRDNYCIKVLAIRFKDYFSMCDSIVEATYLLYRSPCPSAR